MKQGVTSFAGVECVQRDGKWVMQVPWCSAERLQQRLKSLGVGSTLHLEPWERLAYLCPWADLGPEQLRSLLTAGAAQAA